MYLDALCMHLNAHIMHIWRCIVCVCVCSIILPCCLLLFVWRTSATFLEVTFTSGGRVSSTFHLHIVPGFHCFFVLFHPEIVRQYLRRSQLRSRTSYTHTYILHTYLFVYTPFCWFLFCFLHQNKLDTTKWTVWLLCSQETCAALLYSVSRVHCLVMFMIHGYNPTIICLHSPHHPEWLVSLHISMALYMSSSSPV